MKVLQFVVMVHSPDNIEGTESNGNDKRVHTVSLVKTHKQKEKNSSGCKDKIIERVFFKLFRTMRKKMFHKFYRIAPCLITKITLSKINPRKIR